ncbi:MAG: type III PLP-dependent enzyme [Rhodospirillales bacterium]|nr:type III PLP-dependent enzyme [Rhodospirillales bacterium]
MAQALAKTRTRSAVSPLRRRFDFEPALPGVDSVVAAEAPNEPLHCFRPAVVESTARTFVGGFPGSVLYAIKCNPEPRVLRAVWAGGVRHFDCASPAEIALVRQMFPEAQVHYMHPVKSRAAIRAAWEQFGVDDFVFDSSDELAKIIAETGSAGARPRGLIVRLAVDNGGAYDLTGKFGAGPAEAARLLAAARPLASRLGLSFHVGSQCLDPKAYADALVTASAVIGTAGVGIDIVDVGGGFPVSYPDVTPPPLGDYFAVIAAATRCLGLDDVELWSEPGRALSAAGTSIVVQVQHRRSDALYINDGIYGSLSDAGAPHFRFPVRLIRPDGPAPAGELKAFRLFGPTCDSADRMDGPFLLPADAGEGDWIEIGQLGAYGGALRTAFNGFDRARLIDVADPPLLATPGHGVR